MHDDVDVVDVDPAGGHVGGHQHVELALGEVPQGPLPGALAQVAVDGHGLDALTVELEGQAVGAPLGADEHEAAEGARWRWRR